MIYVLLHTFGTTCFIEHIVIDLSCGAIDFSNTGG